MLLPIAFYSAKLVLIRSSCQRFLVPLVCILLVANINFALLDVIILLVFAHCAPMLNARSRGWCNTTCDKLFPLHELSSYLIRHTDTTFLSSVSNGSRIRCDKASLTSQSLTISHDSSIDLVRVSREYSSDGILTW